MLKLGQKRPNYRASVGYTVPKTRVYQQPSQLGGFLPLIFLAPALAAATAGTLAIGAAKKSQQGSGVVDDADMLYQQAKSGQGLKLAGSGVSVAGGGALDLPGSGLRNNLLHSLPKINKKRISSSANRSLLGTPYNVGTERTMGNGVTLSGQGSSLSMLNDTIYKVVQIALSKMGINNIIPDALVKNVITSSTKKADNTVKDVIMNVTKKILPILTKTGLAQTGNGIHYGKVIASKKYNKLHKKFSKYIASEVAGQDGGDFFTDFYDGFMMVIRPAAKILGPIGEAIFPEFSPVIGAVTSAIDAAPK